MLSSSGSTQRSILGRSKSVYSMLGDGWLLAAVGATGEDRALPAVLLGDFQRPELDVPQAFVVLQHLGLVRGDRIHKPKCSVSLPPFSATNFAPSVRTMRRNNGDHLVYPSVPQNWSNWDCLSFRLIFRVPFCPVSYTA